MDAGIEPATPGLGVQLYISTEPPTPGKWGSILAL